MMATAAAVAIFAHSGAYAQDKIRIASVDGLSGVTSSLGQDVSRGLHLAVEQINAAGGIKSLGGAQIEFVEYDTQSKVDVAQSQAEKAIAEGAIAIIGNSASAASLATTTVAERAQIPIMVSGGSADQITQRGYKYTFKINPTIALSYANTKAYLENFFSGDVKLKRLVHVHEDGAFGQSVNNNSYAALAKDLGFELVAVPFKTGSADMSGLISQLRRESGEALVFTGYVPDAITFVNAARQARVSFPFFDAGISINDKNFKAAVPVELRDGLVGYQYFNAAVKVPGNEDGPAKFDKAFRERWGDEPGFISANAWTSMMVMAKALEAAGSTDSGKLRDALAAVEFGPADGHIMANPMVKFDATGQNMYMNLLTVQQQGDKLEVVWPAEYATSKLRISAQ
ncbi:MAG: ABC transporter substrate-binding protein [Rhizobiaceae bacterium]|nr:ABC transporter substrate-binding protein [Rhizobiaceae bacterium]